MEILFPVGEGSVRLDETMRFDQLKHIVPMHVIKEALETYTQFQTYAHMCIKLRGLVDDPDRKDKEEYDRMILSTLLNALALYVANMEQVPPGGTPQGNNILKVDFT